MNIKKVIIIGIVLIVLALSCLFIFVFNKPIKKEVLIEAGSTKIEIVDFLTNKKDTDKAKFVTDINTINLSKVADYDIEVSYNKKSYITKLKIVDTTSPKVVFQDVDKYIDYEINPADFIKEKYDISEMKVRVESIPEITSFGTYRVRIIVEDIYGNSTKEERVLNITRVVAYYELELGKKILEKDLLLNPTVDKNLISAKEIDIINNSDVGEHEIEVTLDNIEYKIKIIIKDTMSPELVLKNVEVYLNDPVPADEKFVAKVSDASKAITLKRLTEINTKNLGTTEVTFEAVDKNDNKTTVVTKFSVIKDTVGPVFSGLNALTVAKRTNIDWLKGVTAIDKKDGKVEFSVDYSGVDLKKAGKYYANYTAKDKSGNITKSKRTININLDMDDVNAKADEWLKKIGNSNMALDARILAIKDYVRTNIKYSTATIRNLQGAAWKGFTTLSGDCYIHAAVTQVLLTRLGVKSIIINALDNSHYWNIVYINGKWRHIDSTPGTILNGRNYMDDIERKESLKTAQGRERDWDRTKFPAAV